MEKELLLTDLEPNQKGEIVSVLGGAMATKRLADLGLSSGTKIKIIKKAPFSGPIKIEFYESRLVLGRGLASKILVKIIQNEE
ncbi:ferrous iron transport protein A [Candidatus Peregrinibacteria bacterium]|nr:ferrous iron transport protein A [Candidatus Peregrinibacteria bacterium]